MAVPDPDAKVVAAALVGLHRHLEEQVTLGETLERVAGAAVAAIPGCSTASITIAEDGAYRTAALAGDPAAQALDDAQYASGEGPCLAAVRENRAVAVADIAGSPWAAFGAAGDVHGFRSSLSLPLSTGSHQIGSLNLYSRRSEPLSTSEAAVADTLAKEGSIAVANLLALHRLQAMVVQLGRALDSRDLIGQAKGIVMTQRKVTADDAFALLVEASQRRNVKLREVAREVTETGSLDPIRP